MSDVDLMKLASAGQAKLAEVLGGIEPKTELQKAMLHAALDELQYATTTQAVARVMTRIEEVIGPHVDMDGAIDMSNPRIASHLLALRERAEADERTGARDFAARLSAAIGPVVAAALRIALP